MVWDANADSLIGVIKGHSNLIKITSYSPDGRYILTASDDNTVKIWDAKDFRQLYAFSGTSGVLDAKFSPNSNIVIASFSDRTLRILDLENVFPSLILENDDGWEGKDRMLTNLGDTICYKIGYLTYSPNGQYIANICEMECIRVWNAKTGELYRKLVSHDNFWDSPYLMSFSKEGTMLAAIYGWPNQSIKVWDVNKGVVLKDIPYVSAGNMLSSIAFSPDSKQIAITRGDSIVQLWNWEDNLLDSIKMKESADNAVYSPDGRYLAVAAHDIVIIDSKSQKTLKMLKRDSGESLLSYSSDGRYILSSNYNTIVLWDVEKGKKYKTLDNEKVGFNGAQFSPDDRYVWAKYDDYFIVWNVERGKIIDSRLFKERYSGQVQWKRIRPDGSLDEYLSGVIRTYTAISPNGEQFAFTDGVDVKIWKWPTLEDLKKRVKIRFKHRKLTPEERKMYYLDD
jgi:WD40 repeat protein